MKRSEMLRKITDIVHEYRRCTEGVSSVELSEMILTTIEQYGMCPVTTDQNGGLSSLDWELESEN
jgi:hypothetical protein